MQSNSIENEQELRRHLAGIAQGVKDALHIWCCAETLIHSQGLDWRVEQSRETWRCMPEGMLATLEDIVLATSPGAEPLSLVWWQFRTELEADVDVLRERVNMLLQEP